jgi:Ankyrin repeats (3 copies)/Ankyrin repeat
VKLLVEKGAELETESKSGRTPLSWAAEKGHEAVVKLLVEKGAELEAKDGNSGRTPLLWAAVRGHDAVVKLLLDRGADIESKDNDGWTPLSLANWSGQESIIRLLVNMGANHMALKGKEKARTPEEISALHMVNGMGKPSPYESRVKEARDLYQFQAALERTTSELPPSEQDDRAPSDSGYASRIHGKLTQAYNSTGVEATTNDSGHINKDSLFVGPQPPGDQLDEQNLGLYAAETIYSASETSTLPPRDKALISDLAAECFRAVRSHEAHRQTLERISEILPDRIRAFALKLGHRALTPMHQRVSRFVYKYRR